MAGFSRSCLHFTARLYELAALDEAAQLLCFGSVRAEAVGVDNCPRAVIPRSMQGASYLSTSASE
jgi:hypothetical protein